MAGSVNKVILVGNLGADPEIRSLSSGDRVANLRIATSESWRDRNTGERKEKTEWHRVVVFNENIVKVCENYLKKGSTVMGAFSIAAGASTDEIAMSTTEAYTAFAAGEVLEIDVTAVGSGTAGANLMVTLVVDQYNLDGDGTNEYALTFRRGDHDGGVLTAANLNTYQENGTTTAGAATGQTV